VTIAAGGREVVLVQVASPAGVSAGEYPVTLSLLTPDGPRVRATASVAVRGIRKLALEAASAPRFAVSGSQYRATFTVTNRGNVTERPSIKLQSEHKYSARIDSIPVVEPGRTATIGVTVQLPDSARSGSTHHLSAMIEGSPESARASVGVLVAARSNAATGVMHSVPSLLETTTMRTWRPGEPAPRTNTVFAFAASGSLRDSGATTVDLVLRGPRATNSLTGERDEYRLALVSPRAALTVGDQFFVTSPLTEAGRFGTGVNAEARFGSLRLQGFAAEDRWISAPDREMGATIGLDSLRLAGGLRGGIHARALQRDGLHSGTLAAAAVDLSTARSFRLEGEAGSGLGTTGPARAARARLSGISTYADYDFRIERIDSLFPSDRANTQQRHGFVALRPLPWLRLAATADARDVSGLNAGPPGSPAFLSMRHIQSSDASVGLFNIIQVGARRAGQAGDNLAGQEDLALARLSLPLGALRIRLSAAQGRSTNAIDSAGTALSERAIDASLVLGRAVTISAFGQRTLGRRWYSPYREDQRSYGASADISITRSTSLDAGAVFSATSAAQEAGVPGQQLAGWFQGGLVQRLPGGSALSFKFRALSQGAWPSLSRSAELSYAIPFGLPVQRSRSQSQIAARVVDAETGGPMPNTLVRLGDQAIVTGPDGVALFGGLRPSAYQLQLDHGDGMVDASDAALRVVARPGRTEDVRLGLVRGVTLTARVQLYPDSVRNAASAKALAGVLATITDGEDRRSVRTDEQGRFRVDNLHPGVWSIELDSRTLPQWTEVEGGNQYVVVIPSDPRRHVELTVIPRRRTMKMVTPPN
jgi:hypothetical protein